MAWLDDNEPARSQFRVGRREEVSGVVVVHTAENTPDFVAFDGGAEAVAKFIQGRDTPGSYHDLCDKDSCINLVAYVNEAFHDGTGSNPHSYGLSIATRADVWPLAPKEWRDGAIRQAAFAAANYSRFVKGKRGFHIPARRITRAESEDRMPGFISHAERDPARRTDPGADFPWDQFFDEYLIAMAIRAPAPAPAPEENDDMVILTAPGKPAAFVTGDRMVAYKEAKTTESLKKAGVRVAPISAAEWELFRKGLRFEGDAP